MKNILLLTDFSENSRNAINYAVNLFNNKEHTFFILNVQKQSDFILDDFMTEPATTSLHATIAKDNKTELKKFVKKIKDNNIDKNIEFELLFDFDNLIHAIKETINSKNIDLVVMGTNGISNIKEFVFGSNTLNVIRNIASPILIIPEKYQFKKIKSILLSINDHKTCTKKNTNLLNELLKSEKASLSILDLNKENNSDTETTEESFLNIFFKKHLNYYKIKDVPTSMAINTVNQLFNYDMHSIFIDVESNFLDQFLGNSKNIEIGYKTEVPLLVLRE